MANPIKAGGSILGGMASFTTWAGAKLGIKAVKTAGKTGQVGLDAASGFLSATWKPAAIGLGVAGATGLGAYALTRNPAQHANKVSDDELMPADYKAYLQSQDPGPALGYKDKHWLQVTGRDGAQIGQNQPDPSQPRQSIISTERVEQLGNEVAAGR